MEVIKTIKITESLVNEYANLINDHNPIHLDENYAKSTPFKSRIAHGLLVSSFISSIIANDYPGKGSIYLSQNLKFIKPCYLGDELKCNLNGKHQWFLDGIAIENGNDIKYNTNQEGPLANTCCLEE